jgi:hypothetical protein
MMAGFAATETGEEASRVRPEGFAIALPKADFSDAETKLNRARDHIANADAAIKAFLATKFYEMHLKPDQGTNRIEVIVDALREPDKGVDAIIGDAIGNLRSVLDYVAIALARPITGKADGTGFPFADDAGGFTGEVRSGRCLGPCDVVIQDHFINEVQAYKGGKGHSFWVLNKLRNVDKHRLLLATAKIRSVSVSFRSSMGVFNDISTVVFEGEHGSFISAPMNDIQFTREPRAAFEVTLAESPYVDGAPISAFLQSLASDVKSFLDAVKVFG